MQTLRSLRAARAAQADTGRRGAALMLAVLVLFVLVLIVFQITMGSSTDRRVAQNDIELTIFDAAIESALLRTMQDLGDDAAASDEEGDVGAGAAMPGAAGAGGFGDAAAGGGAASGPVDSRRDDWGRPQATEINGVSLRILIQDEDSKYNVLTMLTEDQDEARKSLDRVVRILDMCREGTLADIEEADARDMAERMRDHMLERSESILPQPKLLTDEEPDVQYGLPLTLREFLVLEGFHEYLYRDYRDANDDIVHSIGTFLTVSTSVSTYEEFRSAIEDEAGPGGIAPGDAGPSGSGSGSGGGSNPGAGGTTGSQGAVAGPGGVSAAGASQGDSGGDLGDPSAAGGAGSSNGAPGVAVNINTAPNAVLHGLMDRREVPWEFLDELVEYRNLEDEDAQDPDAEPTYDEYGEEVIIRQIFESTEELADVPGWENLDPDVRADFERFLTVESRVFSIYITARANPWGDEGGEVVGMSREEREELARRGTDLQRTVRSVVWRYKDGDEWKVVPLERWEVVDYEPYEVLDFPEEER